MALVQRGALGVSGVEGVVLNARPAITAKPEDSTFEIANVPPGTYDLFARLPVAATAGWGTSFPPARATAPWAIGRTSVEVNGSDVEGINIVVNPGVDLKGRLIVDGKPAQGAVGISLVPDTAASNVTDGQMSSVYGQIAQFAPSIEPDGSFVFPLLPEGPYRFQTTFAPTRQTRGQVAASAPSAATLPEMAYVADIRQSGQSVYEKGILVGKSEPNPIDVIVNTNGGGLEGIVTDNDGKTMSRMIVVLVPGSERRSNIEFYQTATTDAAGRFRISRIPPGQHTLFASRNIQIGTFQNATTFEKYARYGTGVNVSTGPLSSIVIKAIPNE
jgi:hypothetical protein